MNKNKLIIGAVIVLIVIAGVVYFASTQKERTAQQEQIKVLDQATSTDTTESIDSSLKSIDIDSGADEDIKSIDKELKVL